jgi:hypothetical protein
MIMRQLKHNSAMSKHLVRLEIDYGFHDWKYNVEINKIREDLDKLEKLGVTHIEITEWDDSVSIVAVQERLETDEEYKKRRDEAETREIQRMEQERELYQSLKAKYERDSGFM